MSILSEKNPIAVFFYFLAVAGIVMFHMNPVLIGISLLGALSYLFAAGRGKKSHFLLIFLFLGMALLNPLFYHNGKTVLFVLNDNPITLESALWGAVSGGMLIAVTVWFIHFSTMMTADKLLYLFGSFSPKLALVLSMGLRYVPLFTRQAQKIGQTQTALGLYKDDNLIDRFRGGMRIFDVLVTWGLENGIITADSMTARGYGIGKRSHFSIFRFRRSDIVLLISTAFLLGVTVLSIGSGSMDFTYYPAMRPTGYSHTALVGYIAYGILILIPTILEAEETIKWTFLQSKI
jgi:energy-coupling factor transport system permease protein